MVYDFKKAIVGLIMGALLTSPMALAEVPEIEGSPKIVAPQLLDWPREIENHAADLTEPTSNRLDDLHGDIGDCSNMDLVFSTAGNYHMALHDLWRQVLLADAGDAIKNWYYTTSPPISPDQIANQHLGFGNLNLRCVPTVAAGPGRLMNTLESMGFTEGTREAIVRNRGNVILVAKGNPKNIKTIWDLGRKDVRVVTSNPDTESGSFGNYSGSIYNIAANDTNPPKGMDADKLFKSIFNKKDKVKRVSGKRAHHKGKVKWVSGKRIHHREVPWAISANEADAGLFFYHLALFAKRSFPDKFDIVPLGGTVDDPQPLPGNRVATMNAIRINGNVSNHGFWTQRQLDARERLFDAFHSQKFKDFLEYHGLQAP